MARYLFICGGTGKQIVVDRSLMNFDGFMQIDVDSEVVKGVNDSRTQIMALPLPRDAAATTTQALQMANMEYLEEREAINRKITEIKDMTSVKAYVEFLSQTEFAKTFEQYLSDVDKLAYSGGSKDPVRAFRNAHPKFIRLHEHDAHVQKYVQLQQQLEELEKRILAVQSGLSSPALGAALLVYGMAQRPLIGSAYFSREYVRIEFARRLQLLINGKPPAFGAPIELWIVSSMCGGTGQGISYHVAEYARKFFEQQGFTQIVVHFVRLGSVTYTQYGTQNSVLENCAMATLHDAAFSYGVRPPINVPTLLDEVGADVGVQEGIQYNFYYLELEDYVNQDRNKLTVAQWKAKLVEAAKKRSADLASALRAITQPTVQESFNTAFVNVRPGWHRALFVRNGVWENGVDANSLYHQSARQVYKKLDAELLSPDYPALDIAYVSRFDVNQTLGRWVGSPQAVTEQVEPKQLSNIGNRPKQWSLPSYVHTYRKSGDNTHEQDVGDYLRSTEWANAQREIGRVVNMYLGEKAIAPFAVDVRLGEANVNPPTFQLVQFDPQIADKKTPRYVEELELAHRVVAKIDRILSRNNKDENGSLKQLHTLWQPIIPGWTGGNAYASRLRSSIKPFMQALVTVQALLKLRAEALNRIIDARVWLLPLNTRLQLDLANVQEIQQLTQIRQLKSNYAGGTTTWLSVMAEEANVLEVAQSVNPNADESIYRESVVWGSQGLTEVGVKFVLGLPSHATDEDIADKLAGSCGSDPEGVWWQKQEPEGAALAMADFKYVIFPNIDNGLILRIEGATLRANQVLPELIMSDDEYTGLKILALQTYRGEDSWFPAGQAGAAGVGSAFYQQLVSYLAPKMGEKLLDRNHRIAVASTGHPIFTSDHVHAVSKDSLRDRFSERSER
jgi:hypothetical protein